MAKLSLSLSLERFLSQLAEWQNLLKDNVKAPALDTTEINTPANVEKASGERTRRHNPGKPWNCQTAQRKRYRPLGRRRRILEVIASSRALRSGTRSLVSGRSGSFPRHVSPQGPCHPTSRAKSAGGSFGRWRMWLQRTNGALTRASNMRAVHPDCRRTSLASGGATWADRPLGRMPWPSAVASQPSSKHDCRINLFRRAPRRGTALRCDIRPDAEPLRLRSSEDHC